MIRREVRRAEERGGGLAPTRSVPGSPQMRSSAYAQVMQLQRSFGNRATAKLLQSGAHAIQRVPTKNYSGKMDGTYWEKDETTKHNGATVPSKVLAVMRNPDYGGTPSVDPPGWDWLKKKFGRLKGQWVRFHIINAELGGPGNDPTNLVPTTVTLNLNANWRKLEEEAKASATMDQDWTYVEVDLGYDANYPAGIPQSIAAAWGYQDSKNKWRKMGTVNLTQANPGVSGSSVNFLPASQVTIEMLRRRFRLTRDQAEAIRELIDDTYEDQQDFESAVEEYEEEGNLGNSSWFNVLDRLYVDEDENLPGPFPVVVRVT